MGAGNSGSRLSARQHRRVARAVEAAEAVTGLQFCVYLGPTEADPRAHAEALFTDAGFHERPAVLILVAPKHRRVEVVTSAEARARVDDESSARAVKTMTGHFRRGRMAAGIVQGLRHLATVAGEGATTPGGHEQLPDVIDA